MSYCAANRIDHLVTNASAQALPAYAALESVVGAVSIA